MNTEPSFLLLREACESLLRQRRFHDVQVLLLEARELTDSVQAQHILAGALSNVIPKAKTVPFSNYGTKGKAA